MHLFYSRIKFNPAILFIVLVIIIVIFFSGLVILLVKLLKKPRLSSIFGSNTNLDLSGSSALQRQLQSLFHLHDSGLDQAIIDSLPMFIYKDIIGLLNSHFNCPVCLCEFTNEDKLRLLPICKHAFHLHCIDTWLLSNSTCPLCRNTLLNQSFELDDSRNDNGLSDGDIIVQKPDESNHIVNENRVFSLRLGKFRHRRNQEDVEMGENSGGNNIKIDDYSRRCFSMGSIQFVVDDQEFQVALCCDESKGNNDLKVCSNGGKLINNVNKRESFSISKVWLWPKKSKFINEKEKHLSMSFNTSLSNDIIHSSMEEEEEDGEEMKKSSSFMIM